MRSEYEVSRAIDEYSDMVRRICFLHLKSYSDTEDIFQDVFFKYLLSSDEFASKEHEKAWLIRVTVNCCKDFLKSFFRKNTVPLDAVADIQADSPEETGEVLSAVLSMPKKYKDVIYLYFYEEYKAVEIAEILNKNVNTIYTLLSRGKEILRERLGDTVD